MTSDGSAGTRALTDLNLSRLLRKLARRNSYVSSEAIDGERDGRGRLYLVREDQPAEEILRDDFVRALQQGLLERVGGMQRFILSAAGRERVRRMFAGVAPELTGEARAAERKPTFNLDESPLAWLRRRRGRDGHAFISEVQFLAGERLRADFTFGQLSPRLTANWDPTCAAIGGGRSGSAGAGVDMADNAMAARDRVQKALRAVGPEFAGLLLDICCFLKGLEDLERSSGWPQRSGKVVLRLALSSLARHYGLPDPDAPGGPARQSTLHWGVPGYRPSLDAGEGDQPVGA